MASLLLHLLASPLAFPLLNVWSVYINDFPFLVLFLSCDSKTGGPCLQHLLGLFLAIGAAHGDLLLALLLLHPPGHGLVIDQT